MISPPSIRKRFGSGVDAAIAAVFVSWLTPDSTVAPNTALTSMPATTKRIERAGGVRKRTSERIMLVQSELELRLREQIVNCRHWRRSSQEQIYQLIALGTDD
jgi:hypothetical protein